MNWPESLLFSMHLFQKYREDMRLDHKQLSSVVATKQSAGDERTSSTTVGSSGVVFLGIVLLLILLNDALRVFAYFCR